MKIYYVCECCQQIFNSTEVEGPDGAIELKGTCEECAMEMGIDDTLSSLGRYYYH